MLHCHSAREMMSPNPISIPAVSTIKRAAEFLADHHFGAAPVIDTAGKAIGVISMTDIARHVKKQQPASSIHTECGNVATELPAESEVEVQDVMTPMVFSVTPDTSPKQVIDAMLNENVHRLFVVDHAGLLIGVISTFDILRHMKS